MTEPVGSMAESAPSSPKRPLQLNPGRSGSAPGRIEGLDLARALALLGMTIVNFQLTMVSEADAQGWLAWLTGSLQGRAAATFVVLAGIGASLGSARARLGGSGQDCRDARKRARRTLALRALLLLGGGTAFLSIWPADILHFYGVWMLLGAGLLFAPAWALLLLGALAALGNVLFLFQGDYFAHWNLTDLSYGGLATPAGYLRNLFLDGFHPVLPWLGLYLLGMCLGRLDLGASGMQQRLGLPAALVLVFTGWVEGRFGIPLEEVEDARLLLLTSPLPPTPAFLLAGGATATLVIAVCCAVTPCLPRWLSSPLVATGRLALTLYVAHVLLGLGTLEAAGLLEGQSLAFSVGCAGAFFVLAVGASSLWLRRFQRGPLEAALRALS